jgi:hypothetical protein
MMHRSTNIKSGIHQEDHTDNNTHPFKRILFQTISYLRNSKHVHNFPLLIHILIPHNTFLSYIMYFNLHNVLYAIVKQPTITDTVRLNRLRWFGHVQRMEENRIPIRVLYTNLGTTRLRGRPRNLMAR